MPAELLCPECGHPGPHIPLGSGLYECGDPECGEDCGMVFETPDERAEETRPSAVRAEAIAREFHGAYERLAPNHGYETRVESAVPWEQVPDNNRALMTAVAQELLDRGIIRAD